jgi:hypothetical protein
LWLTQSNTFYKSQKMPPTNSLLFMADKMLSINEKAFSVEECDLKPYCSWTNKLLLLNANVVKWMTNVHTCNMASLENAGLQLWMKHSPFLGHSGKRTQKMLVVYIIKVFFFFTSWFKWCVAIMKVNLNSWTSY